MNTTTGTGAGVLPEDRNFSHHEHYCAEGEPLPGAAMGGSKCLQGDGGGKRLGSGSNPGYRCTMDYAALAVG